MTLQCSWKFSNDVHRLRVKSKDFLTNKFLLLCLTTILLNLKILSDHKTKKDKFQILRERQQIPITPKLHKVFNVNTHNELFVNAVIRSI